MFDPLPLAAASLVEADEAAVVAAIEGWAQVAAAADGQRLAAIAELTTRRCGIEEHPDWACDDWDAAAAEVAAALNIGHGRALGQMDLALTLRDRLPKVGTLLLAGRITARAAATIAARTQLVQDPDALRQLDAALAERAVTWGPLSEYKLTQALDVWVERIDPGALRHTRESSRSRDFVIGDRHDSDGTTSVHGRLLATDAALLEQRVLSIIRSVCEDDPRTLAQRRSDAMGAIAVKADHLTCQCGNPDCPGTADDGRASSVVIHVVAEQESLHADPDPQFHGRPPRPEPEPVAEPDAESETEPAAGQATESATKADVPPPSEPHADPPAQPRRRNSALILDGRGGIVPSPLLAELIARGAKVRIVGAPAQVPEPRYRPSTALDEFVRVRDLTCRFPGCDRPAVFTDIDHTVPYPAGATHASNTKCYCRKHHLVKTFWAGWHDQQLPDGTVIVTTPTGRTYTTRPGSALIFPGCNITTTAASQTPAHPLPTNDRRTMMMPTRKRTRAQTRGSRIKTERALNDALVAERNRPPPF